MQTRKITSKDIQSVRDIYNALGKAEDDLEKLMKSEATRDAELNESIIALDAGIKALRYTARRTVRAIQSFYESETTVTGG